MSVLIFFFVRIGSCFTLRLFVQPLFGCAFFVRIGFCFLLLALCPPLFDKPPQGAFWEAFLVILLF